MKSELGLEQIARVDGSVVTVGVFDGVHRGHQAILARLRAVASELQGQSVAVTFDPHPQAVLRGATVPMLSTIEERGQFFSEEGLDRMVVLSFTEELARMPPDRFVEDVLVGRVGMGAIVLGHDHGFGRGRSGSESTLIDLGRRFGFQTHAVEARAMGEAVVSSSQIRDALSSVGDVRRAADMLGRNYGLTGKVVSGNSRGRSIGFPTANVQPTHPDKLVPARGVYAVEVTRLSTGDRLGGMMNIGVRPTFSAGDRLHLEVHLFDFSARIYGELLRVSFIDRIRDERTFTSIEALMDQLGRDQVRAKEVLDLL